MKRLVLSLSLLALLAVSAVAQTTLPSQWVPNRPGGQCLHSAPPQFVYTTGQYYACRGTFSTNAAAGTWTLVTPPSTVVAGDGLGGFLTATSAQVNALATAAAGVAAGVVGDTQLVANTTAGNTALRVCHAKYDFAVDGGAVSTITPATNCTIPINSLIYQVIINPTTTTVGTTGNISFGLSAGGAGAAAFLANTARASLSTGSFFQGIPVQSATGANTSFIKMSAAGTVTMTIATNALTAGVVEVYVFYYVSST